MCACTRKVSALLTKQITQQTHDDGGTAIKAGVQHVPSALRCDARPLPDTAVHELTTTRITSRVDAYQQIHKGTREGTACISISV